MCGGNRCASRGGGGGIQWAVETAAPVGEAGIRGRWLDNGGGIEWAVGTSKLAGTAWEAISMLQRCRLGGGEVGEAVLTLQMHRVGGEDCCTSGGRQYECFIGVRCAVGIAAPAGDVGRHPADEAGDVILMTVEVSGERWGSLCQRGR